MSYSADHTAKLSPERLSGFLREAETIVGKANVSHDPSWGGPEGLHGSCSYGDPFPLSRPHTAAAAVRPETVNEVRCLVTLSNKFKVPLWTISRGKNLGYGGSAPVVSGTVILDLHRMKKIIEINEEYAYAIVEPGVTFIDLFEEIKARKLNLWMSVPALGWGSIIGNTLERGIGYTSEAAHYKNQSGMEVVLPNGDLLRTGMGAVDGSKVWPLYSGGFGPGLDGLFFQSNYGIVTKMGIHMSHAPQAYTRIVVDVMEEKDVVAVVGAITELMRRRVITNSPQLVNRMNILTSMIATSTELAEALGHYASLKHHIPDDLVDRIAERFEIPAWRVAFALYATPEAHDGLLEAIKRRIEPIEGIRMTSETLVAPAGQYLRGEDVPTDFLPQNGVPSIDGVKMFEGVGEEGLWHNCFAPVLPPSGRELYEWYIEAKKRTSELDLNFIAGFHVFDRYVICIDFVIFHPSASKRLHQLQISLMGHAEKLGYLEYRTHVSFMDMTASHQNFNQGAFSRFSRLLKDAIDPNGVLSPGKQGIWNSGTKTNL